jgi:hypothetical protein
MLVKDASGDLCIVQWPDCWLEVRVHSEGPVAGHLDTGFVGFTSVLKQMLRW